MYLGREHIKTAIWAAAVDQERVLILGETSLAAKHSVDDFLDVLPEESPADVCRLNGEQRITFPFSGTIHFLSKRSRLRGYAFDRAYVPVGTDQGALADIYISMNTSKVGQLTEYGRVPAEPYCGHGPFDACRCGAKDSRVTAG